MKISTTHKKISTCHDIFGPFITKCGLLAKLTLSNNGLSYFIETEITLFYLLRRCFNDLNRRKMLVFLIIDVKNSFQMRLFYLLYMYWYLNLERYQKKILRKFLAIFFLWDNPWYYQNQRDGVISLDFFI